MRLALLLVTMAGCLWSAAGDFHWRGALAPGQTLEVKGISGDIRVMEGSGTEVEVAATKQGRRSDPESVKVEVVPHAGGVTVCALYPSREGLPNECKPGKGGRLNSSNNDVRVDFVVRVPRGAHVRASTVNGMVDVKGVDGDVRAETVNGKIVVAARGSVEAETVNGGIEARIEETVWSGKRIFSTVNGGIKVVLPENANTEVRASTVHGSIQSDFPVTVKGKISHRDLDARLGNGGRELKLSTVNGSIELKKIS